MRPKTGRDEVRELGEMERPSPSYRRRIDLPPPPVVIGAAKGAPLSRQDSSRSRLCVRLVDVLTAAVAVVAQ